MDEWRERLRNAVAAWGLSPEEQIGVVEELEQHLEQEFAELRPRIGDAGALTRILAQIDDPALRGASVRPRHRPAPSVAASRSRARGLAAVARDVRYGWRSLRTSPGTMVMATIALTFGIGLTTTMFSIVYGALMTDPPYPHGASVVAVQRFKRDHGPEPFPLTVHDFADYRAQQHSFTALAAYAGGAMYVSGEEKAERFDGTRVTANLFDVLGVKPALGRTFRSGEDSPAAEKAVVLSYGVWRERYDGDSGVIGRRVRVNGQTHTIIGVMPATFRFVQRAELWVPLVMDARSTPRGAGPLVSAVGRLKPGVSVAAASVDLATISQRLAAAYHETNDGFTGYAARFADAYLPPSPRRLLRVMLGAVFVVLLIACANVANLLLDRALHRTREIGVRLALGASRAAIARQHLAEAFALAVVATLAGISLAYAGVGGFRRALAGTQVPFWMDFRLRPAVFLFTGVVAVATALIAGMIPAYQSSRADINEVLKDDSRTASSFRIGRLSGALVTFEIALACALLVAAGLMTKSIVKANTLSPGYSTRNVFTARVGFPDVYTDSVAQRRFFDQMLQRVRSLPGVESAALASGLPATRSGFDETRFALGGKADAGPEDRPRALTAAVTPQFFATLNTPQRKGRGFATSDRDGSMPVAVVTESFVGRYLNGGDPIGRRVQLGNGQTPGPVLTVVGVVGDMFAGDQRDPSPPIIFRPFGQARSSSASIVARTAGPPMAITANVREIVRGLEPDIPVYSVQSLEDATAGALWFVNVFGTLFMIFGAIALFLASVGLYAVMSFSVSRRTRELGIRMALGATARKAVRIAFDRGIRRLAIGMTVGLLFGFGVSRVLRAILFQVQPSDPTVFGGVAAVLIIVGLAATLVPARRATLVDPVIVLRRE